jgi:hypothetical protein
MMRGRRLGLRLSKRTQRPCRSGAPLAAPSRTLCAVWLRRRLGGRPASSALRACVINASQHGSQDARRTAQGRAALEPLLSAKRSG